MTALAMLPPPMKAMDGSWVADDVMTEPLGGVQWVASVADHVGMKIAGCTNVVQNWVSLCMDESKHGIKPLFLASTGVWMPLIRPWLCSGRAIESNQLTATCSWVIVESFAA
jgi:hypothetical protein